MTPQIILGAIVLAPVALLLFLRVNATLVFLSLCLGSVLDQFVAPDANSMVSLFSAHAPKAAEIASNNNNLKIGLLLLPVLLTTVFMVKTVRGNGKLVLNALPAAGVGLLGALLVVPLLPVSVSSNITTSNLWTQVERADDLIVGASALVCLLVLWMQRPKTSHEEKHGKHH